MRVSPLLQHPQCKQADGCVERRRLAQQLRGGRDAFRRYRDDGRGLVIGLVRQERMAGGLDLCGKGLVECGVHGGELQRRKLAQRRRDLISRRTGAAGVGWVVTFVAGQ